jgi:hypothetical protein
MAPKPRLSICRENGREESCGPGTLSVRSRVHYLKSARSMPAPIALYPAEFGCR